jgi:hypothetical protein
VIPDLFIRFIVLLERGITWAVEAPVLSLRPRRPRLALDQSTHSALVTRLFTNHPLLTSPNLSLAFRPNIGCKRRLVRCLMPPLRRAKSIRHRIGIWPISCVHKAALRRADCSYLHTSRVEDAYVQWSRPRASISGVSFCARLARASNFELRSLPGFGLGGSPFMKLAYDAISGTPSSFC